MAPELATTVGSLPLRTPLIASSGTVGSVWEWAQVANVSAYGAAVAKSVSSQPWPGRKPPRVAPTNVGMLNGIGIQNPGIERWLAEVGPRIEALDVPVWGSTVGERVDDFALVAKELEHTGVAAIEINLSCPNLDGGQMYSFDPVLSHDVVEAVKAVVGVQVGAKLSPDTPDLIGVSGACISAGADFLVLTNTAMGFGIEVESRMPLLSGGVGGYSGPGLKPIALRAVYEVHREMPEATIVGCGGVTSGSDVVEFLIAGASAVAAGTVHLAEPNAGERIIRELSSNLDTLGVTDLAELVGTVGEW